MSDAHPVAPVAPGEQTDAALDLAEALPIVARECARRMMVVQRALGELNEVLAATHQEARFSIVPRGRS